MSLRTTAKKQKHQPNTNDKLQPPPLIPDYNSGLFFKKKNSFVYLKLTRTECIESKTQTERLRFQLTDSQKINTVTVS